MKPFAYCLAAIGLMFTGLTWFSLPAQADVFKPAYLQLKQISPDTYEVMWKVPALDANTTLKVKPELPEGVREMGERSIIYSAGASVQRWKIQVPNGLDGKTIRFSQLQDLGLDVLVRVERLDGSEQLERILPMQATFTMQPSLGPMEVVWTYTVLGIEHILNGMDHLLFVLSLMLIVRGTRRLLMTITAFTLAHSITLALATLGFLSLPGPPVEATIALSIVFVASEILHYRHGREGLAVRKPWLVAFSFGLLHGLGFAGALAEVGLPHNAIPLALLFFNVGVEIGQLIFIAAVLLVIALLNRLRISWPAWAAQFPAYAIGTIAAFWVIQRVQGFWM